MFSTRLNSKWLSRDVHILYINRIDIKFKLAGKNQKKAFKVMGNL